MELSVVDIKQMSSDEIYNSMLSEIDTIYKKYRFLDLSPEEFYKIIINTIEYTKKNFKGECIYSKYLKKHITISLRELINKLFEDENRAFIIISNYINMYFTYNGLVNNALACTKKLDKFLYKMNITLNPDILFKLLNSNEMFLNTIKLIFESQKAQICLGKAEILFNNSLLIMSVEEYCSINNIEIIDDDSFDYEGDSELSDSLDMYFKEIRGIPKLTRELEIELSKRKENGDIEAKNIMVERSLRIVYAVAKKYEGRGLPILDLIQEGNIGIIIAADKYDYRNDIRFSSYAIWWIKHTITRALADKGRNIRIPVWQHEKLIRYDKVVKELSVRLGREPKNEEIAKEMNMSIDDVISLQKISADTYSLNDYISTEDDTEFIDSLASEEDGPEDIAVSSSLQYKIQQLIDKCDISDRDREIFKLRLGFIDGEPWKLEDIAKEYNLSWQRIQQIEGEVLDKLKKLAETRELSVYMSNPDRAKRTIDEYRAKNKIQDSSKPKIENKIKQKELPKLNTFYSFFPKYLPEDIIGAVSELPSEYIDLLKYKYGEELDSKVIRVVSKEEFKLIRDIIVPKIYEILKRDKKNNIVVLDDYVNGKNE